MDNWPVSQSSYRTLGMVLLVGTIVDWLWQVRRYFWKAIKYVAKNSYLEQWIWLGILMR